MRKEIAAIILAAGKGLRMRSEMPKALCELNGKPMIEFLIDILKRCKINDIVVVGGYRIDLLRDRILPHRLKVIRQKQLLGSADAVKQAKGYFKGFKGTVVVLYTDTPLIKHTTVKEMIKSHLFSEASVTMLTALLDDAREYGRVMRDGDRKISGIVEHSDIKKGLEDDPQAKDQNSYNEVNVGVYCFDSEKLFEGLRHIKRNKKKKEFYLTDIIAYFYKKGYLINSYTSSDNDESIGINKRSELLEAEQVLKKRTMQQLMEEGVQIKDPASIYIGADAKIAKDTIIYPFVVIDSDVVIGKGCRIGPFAHIKRGTVLKDGANIGNFVEVVRSKIGKDSRAKHHAYLGDTVVGRNVNIGAGTITANYDGRHKNKTVIGDNAFIGSSTTIVAPVRIGKAAVTGAGSVILKNRDVPAGMVVVGVPAKPLKKEQSA